MGGSHIPFLTTLGIEVLAEAIAVSRFTILIVAAWALSSFFDPLGDRSGAARRLIGAADQMTTAHPMGIR
jgi:hypothetical protein